MKETQHSVFLGVIFKCFRRYLPSLLTAPIFNSVTQSIFMRYNGNFVPLSSVCQAIKLSHGMWGDVGWLAEWGKTSQEDREEDPELSLQQENIAVFQ